MNGAERAYSMHLDALKRAGEVRWWMFERIKLRLARPGESGRGVWLTIDFVVCDSAGRMFWDEIKGGFITEDGMLKFRWAAEQFPQFHFRMWQRGDGGAWGCVRESNVEVT